MPPRWLSYPAYKPSGHPWLGDIPVDWQARRLKFVAPASTTKLAEKPTDSMYIGLEQIESGTGRLLLDTPVEQVDSAVGVFRKGDVLFGKLRPYLAKVVWATFDGVCTSELLTLQPVTEADGRFLSYVLLSDGFIGLVNSMTYGTKMPRASSEQVGNIAAPLPPLPEQRAIAAFLDRETARLDTLIAKKERLIELLQEKRIALISQAVTKGLDPNVTMIDSGVPWVGPVPAHWEVKRLKFIADVRSGTAKGRDFGDRDTLELPYLRVANVQDGYLNLSDIATITIGRDEMARYALKVGDVLMNEGGDYDKLGRGAVWQGQIEPCVHQNHVFAVRPKSIGDATWINSITGTLYAKHYFMLKSKQSTNLASISATNIQNLPVLLPPLSERCAILDFIDHETSRLDALIAKVHEAIDKLREYRAALIAAAVTGKIDVRGAA